MAQTVLACMPIKKLRILFLVKAIIVPPTFLALFLWAVIVTHGGGPLVTGETALTSTYMNTAYSALTGLNVIIGLFSSMAVNMPVSSLFLSANKMFHMIICVLMLMAFLGFRSLLFEWVQGLSAVLRLAYHRNSRRPHSHLRDICPLCHLG